MTRMQVIILLCVLVGTVSLAAATDCPKIPDPLGCPNQRLSNGDCAVDIEWFAEYEGCTGKHPGIIIPFGDRLILYTKNRGAQVGVFKLYPDMPKPCNTAAAPTPVPDDLPFDEEFTAGPNASYPSFHVLLANNTDAIGECYAVDLTLSDHTHIDPHIIVGSNNLLLKQLKLHQPQHGKKKTGH